VLETPRFLQGIYAFEGEGLDNPLSLSPALTYKVPFDKRSQLTYFRAGNSSGEMLYLLMKRNGKPMRYFPLGAKDAIHVSLAVVEDLEPETVLEVFLGAPKNLKGSIVLDIGLMEI
jgi:hypothetical protein